MDREIAFGRLLAIANVLGERIFEKGKPSIANMYQDRFNKRPMDTFAKIHENLMEYSYKFGENEWILLDMFGEILASMKENEFTNEPLDGKYLQAYYSQQHTLNNIISAKKAAELWGLSPGTVKNYCAEHKVIAKKIGNNWIIDRNQKNPSQLKKD